MQNAVIFGVPLCLLSLSGCGAGNGNGASQSFLGEGEDGSEIGRRTQQVVPAGWTEFGEPGRYCFGSENPRIVAELQQCVDQAEADGHVFVMYNRVKHGIKCVSRAQCDKRRDNKGRWKTLRKDGLWLQVGDAGHRCSGNPLACWHATDQLQQCQRAFEVNGHTIYEYNVDTKMCCECLTGGVTTLGQDPGWRVFQRGTPFEPMLAITNINEAGCGVLVQDAWPIDSTALSTAGGLIRQINGGDVSCLTLCKEDATCTAALMGDVGCFLHRDLSMWPLQFKRNTLDNPPSHQFSIFRVCHEDESHEDESVCGNGVCEEGEMDSQSLCIQDCEAEIKDAVCDCASEHDLCGNTCSAVARLGSDCGMYGARGICGGIIPFDAIYSEFCGWRCPAETPVPAPPVPAPPVPAPPVPAPPVPAPPTSCPSHHPSPQPDMYLYCCPRPDEVWDACVGSKTQQSSCDDPLFPATAWSQGQHTTTEGSFDAAEVLPVDVCCTNGLRELNVNCQVRR